jgi:hypothetical protein
MTVAEARQKQRDLEANIAQLLATFAQETGLGVHRLDMDPIYSIGQSFAFNYQVKITAVIVP